MSTHSTLKLSLLALAASLCIGSASAQSSTTPTIGYYKQTLAQAGAYPVVCGFVAKSDFQGQASSTAVASTTLTITQTGSTWTPNAFNTFTGGNNSHYIEVLSAGSNLGLILDIASNTADTLTVDVPAGFVPGANFNYVVRKHATLGAIYGEGCGLEADSDAAVLMTPSGAEITALFTTGGTWMNANTSDDLTNYVIYPGTGVIIYPADARVITVGGGDISYVKNGQTQVCLSEAIPTLVGLVNPLVSSGATDPINLTTGRNTLVQAGFGGIQADSDFLSVISNDGNFTVDADVILDSGSGNLVNANSFANEGPRYLMNGSAVIYIPASSFCFKLPQMH